MSAGQSMELIGVKEFKNQATQIIREKRAVIVTKRNQPEGLYLPLSFLKELPMELKDKVHQAIISDMTKRLEAADITEEDIDRDVSEIRSSSRRR